MNSSFSIFKLFWQPNNLIINLENDDEWILKDEATLASASLGVFSYYDRILQCALTPA